MYMLGLVWFQTLSQAPIKKYIYMQYNLFTQAYLEKILHTQGEDNYHVNQANACRGNAYNSLLTTLIDCCFLTTVSDLLFFTDNLRYYLIERDKQHAFIKLNPQYVQVMPLYMILQTYKIVFLIQCVHIEVGFRIITVYLYIRLQFGVNVTSTNRCASN